MSLKKHYEMPVPSTSLSVEPHAYTEGGGIVIRFGYMEGGRERFSRIFLKNVAAFRMYAERCCKLEIIENSYDVLVEIEGSDWAREVRRSIRDLWRDKWRTRHFMIYLDSVGGYEGIADDWEVIHDE